LEGLLLFSLSFFFTSCLGFASSPLRDSEREEEEEEREREGEREERVTLLSRLFSASFSPSNSLVFSFLRFSSLLSSIRF
jgi:hypothetical protein